MIQKLLIIQALITLLYLNNVLGQNKPVEDELDRTTIDKTGCKFVSLGKGESVTYSLNKDSLRHTLISALDSDVALELFNMNFAIRADEDVEVFMYSKERYNNNTHEPDYKYEIGLNGGDYTTVAATYTYRFYREQDKIDSQLRYTPKVISSDRYENFYVIVNDFRFQFGKKCDPFQIYGSGNSGEYFIDFVMFGFKANSERGAKILYDCPENFAGCKCRPSDDYSIYWGMPNSTNV